MRITVLVAASVAALAMAACTPAADEKAADATATAADATAAAADATQEAAAATTEAAAATAEAAATITATAAAAGIEIEAFVGTARALVVTASTAATPPVVITHLNQPSFKIVIYPITGPSFSLGATGRASTAACDPKAGPPGCKAPFPPSGPDRSSTRITSE